MENAERHELHAGETVKVGRKPYRLLGDVAATLEEIEKKTAKTYLIKGKCLNPECPNPWTMWTSASQWRKGAPDADDTEAGFGCRVCGQWTVYPVPPTSKE